MDRYMAFQGLRIEGPNIQNIILVSLEVALDILPESSTAKIELVVIGSRLN